MKRPMRLSLIERAVIEGQWRTVAARAEIDVLLSADSHTLVNAAGRVLFVVLGACQAEEADSDAPALSLVIDGVEAVHEQTDEHEISQDRRTRIVRALDVCKFLIGVLDRKSLVDAACDLVLKMRRQHIQYSDFMSLIPSASARL